MIIMEGRRMGGGGRGTRAPPLSPSPSLLSASGRGDRWPLGAGCSVPPGHGLRVRTAAGLIAAISAPSPSWPRPSSLALVARQPRLDALPLAGGKPRLPGFAWSVGQLRRGVAGGLAPGAGRCRFPSDLFWRGEGAAGGNRAREDGATQPVLEKFIDPFLISGTHSFLRWGRLKGRDGG